ncbi:MAG TPA: NADH-quinone oxidoreductase subunit C [Opitutaceae bacterium]|nr:NADH-quinone oxidoreductase subunit C [Opitutaceae bacterium]
MTATADVATALREKFPQVTGRESLDWPACNVPSGQAPAVLQWLRDEWAFDLLADLTAIDWGVGKSPRFTVVWHLLSTSRRTYVRVAADCADAEHPAMPSATRLWPGANWHEREAYDMFGITFSGHPDLRRILMWDGYPYFPLRKDFPLAGLDTTLADAEVAAETGAGVKPAPYMGGPFVAAPGGPMDEAEPRAKDQSWTEKEEKPNEA